VLADPDALVLQLERAKATAKVSVTKPSQPPSAALRGTSVPNPA
jgi:hypothetical protein